MNIKKYIKKVSTEAHFNYAPEMNKETSFDIIIPVFNGIEALKSCIESLLQHTSPIHPIHIFDDASTDLTIKPWLKQLEREIPHIHVYFNPKNKGYLANVNHAMIKTQQDVVLLNSDTVVTANWLKEMSRVANVDSVGLVSPLSDNATILSLDKQWISQLPKLEKLSGHWYPIPTAVGFCLLIKRSVINALGVFDPYYDPGYGEECDYSFLARQKGFEIACACAAFVYHQGSVSFQEKNVSLKAAHQHLLDLRWPHFSEEIQNFSESNTIQWVEAFLMAQSEQPHETIWHVLHSINHKGGVELFTQNLIDSLSDQYNHIIFVPFQSKMPQQSIQYELRGNNVLIIHFQLLSHTVGLKINHLSADLNQYDLDIMFMGWLEYGSPKLVHFHSVVGLGTLMWPLLCEQKNIPYLLSCHDHFSICHNFLLTKTDQSGYCGKQTSMPDDIECQRCLKTDVFPSQYPGRPYIQKRNQIWDQIMLHAKAVISPSEYLSEVLTARFPQLRDKTEFVEPVTQTISKTQFGKLSQPICVAFLGNFSWAKGAFTFLQAYNLLSEFSYQWKIIGGIDRKLKKHLVGKNITLTGSYETNDLAKHLHEVDVIILPSICPETYSITLTESWQHGCAVIASDIGAYQSRIQHGKNGFLFKHNDPYSLAETIQNAFSNHSEKIYHIRQFIQNQKINSTSPETIINALYQKHLLHDTDNKSTWTRENRAIDSKAPMPSAAEKMQNWLDAIATLEGAGDWLDPQNIHFIVLGNDENLLKMTIQSIATYAPSSSYVLNPRFHSVAKEAKSDIVAVIFAGQLLNDNMGNWLAAFKQSKALYGFSDYALHHNETQIYAPQFMGKFDPFKHLRRCHHSSMILFNHAAADDKTRSTFLKSCNNSKNFSAYFRDLLTKESFKNFHYFPHISHLSDDCSWVRNWKNNDFESDLPIKIQSVTVILYGQPSDELIEMMIQQQPFSKLSIHIFSENTITSSTVFNQVKWHFCHSNLLPQQIKKVVKEENSDAVLFMQANLVLSDTSVFAQLAQYLNWFDTSAISPAYVDIKKDEYIYGNKLGKGNYFFGLAKIWDQRFDHSKHLPVMNEFLDQDCFILTREAWNDVSDFFTQNNHFHQTALLSLKLSQMGHSVALLPVNGLIKKGIPRHWFTDYKGDLAKDRKRDKKQFKALLTQSPHYSNAFDSQDEIDLDTNYGTFKTPKNLPRIVAYAHDSGASGFYRVKSPLSALVGHNYISAHFLPEQRENKISTFYEVHKQHADVLLLHNFFSNQQLSALKSYRDYLDLPIILSIDDLVDELPAYNSFSASNPEDISDRLKFALKHVDRLIVSTPFLAEKYQHLHPDIRIVENKISTAIWQKQQPQQNRKLRIGWAGANQHSEDLNWLKPVIQKTSHLIQWVFYGDHPTGLDDIEFEFHTATSLGQYHQKLQSLNLDIAIAPLQYNTFNQAKSALKLIEFGILGLPVICTDINPYQASPALKLANEPNLWIDAIIDLTENQSKRIERGNLMYDWVIKNHLLENHLDQWKEALFLD